MSSEKEIKAVRIFPPIPTRQFDWCAYRDETEEDGPYGWGPTKDDAIKDLTEQEDE